MKKNKMILLGLTALTLAGCGDNGGSGDTGDTESDTLTLQIYVGGYGKKPWQKALEKFEELHPEYDIIANLDNNVNKAYEDRWMNGNPPDFVFLDGDNLASDTWLKEGLLADLSGWLETAKAPGEDTLIKDKVNASYWRKYNDTYANKTITYGAPLLLSAYGMWYDQTYFTEKKLSMPSNYEELKTFAEKANSDTATIIYPGQYSGYLVQGLLVPAFAEYGDTFFDRVMNCRDENVYTSAEFKEVMNRFNEFINLNDYVVADCLSFDHIESQSEWLKHKAALIPNGLWLRGEMSEQEAIPANFDMRYAPSPLTKNEQTIVTSSVVCGIAEQAKNKKGAKEFLATLYTDEILKEFVYASDSPSVADLDLSDDPNVSDVNRYVQSVFNNPAYKHKMNDGSWGGVDTAINSAVNSLVKKSKTVDAVCDEIKAAARKEIAER